MRPTIARQARKAVRIVAGLCLMLAGAVMLVTPGQGLLCILLGFGLLRKEVPWIHRLWLALRARLPARWVAWGDRRKERALAAWQRTRARRARRLRPPPASHAGPSCSPAAPPGAEVRRAP